MKLIPLDFWKNTEKLEALVFFAQRLDEMLFDYSLDTYKPPVLSSPHLCIEAITLIDHIEEKRIEEANLKHLLEELEWSISQDPIAKSLMDADINQYFTTDDNAKLPYRKLKLEVLSRTLNPRMYIKECENKIKKSISSGSKKEIEKLLRLYISTLINGKLSKQSISEKVNDFFFLGKKGEIGSLEKLDEFFHYVHPQPHHFEIVFIVDSLIRKVKDSVGAFNIEILDELDEEFKAQADALKFKKNENEVYVKTNKFRSLDVYSAREVAERKLDNLSDLFMIFAHKSQVSWRGEILVKQYSTEGFSVVGKPMSSMEKGMDLRPNVASKKLNTMIKSFSVNKDSFERFNRVVDLHGMSILNDIPENQLLNMWISIETITPIHIGKTKINEIVNAILPFLMINYAKRIVRNLAFDLTRWNRKLTGKLLNELNCEKDLKLDQKVLFLITSPESDDSLQKFYNALNNYPLLKNRLFLLREKFSSTNKFKKLLADHEKKVSWQIRRIYRTRNIIVHSGKPPGFIHALIENSHDYLDQILYSYIALACDTYRVKTLEQAFHLMQLKWEEYKRKIEKTDSFINDNFLFLVDDSVA